MLLPGVDEAGSKIILEKINNSLKPEPFIFRSKSISVKVVMVVLTRREEDLHLQQMFQKGDIELLRTKNTQLETS